MRHEDREPLPEPHNRARNLSIEASPAGKAEGGGREGPFQKEGNPRSQGPSSGWEPAPEGAHVMRAQFENVGVSTE